MFGRGIILCLLFFSACSKYSELTYDQHTASLKWDTGGMVSVKIDPWRVGPSLKQEVSMGVRLRLQMPPISDRDVKFLGERYEVDSWLITFSRAGLGSRERLAAFYLPLFKNQGTTGAVNRADFGNIDFYYAAAAMSARLRALRCPELGHRFVIDQAEIRETGIDRSLFLLGLSYEQNFSGKAEKLEFQRNLINGGKSLNGEYEISFAFFNSKKNRVLSTFVKAPQILSIGNERMITLSGCSNVKTPDVPIDNEKTNRFHFGR